MIENPYTELILSSERNAWSEGERAGPGPNPTERSQIA